MYKTFLIGFGTLYVQWLQQIDFITLAIEKKAIERQQQQLNAFFKGHQDALILHSVQEAQNESQQSEDKQDEPQIKFLLSNPAVETMLNIKVD